MYKKLEISQSRFKYNFHNIFSKGTPLLILMLLTIALLIIFLFSIIVHFSELKSDALFTEILWMSLLRTLDPGVIGDDQGSWQFLISMLIITILGLFGVSILIGLVTTGINKTIETLRKGRSKVHEKNHIVVLGWNENIFTIVPELVKANLNTSKSNIVILSNKEKISMEDILNERIAKRNGTKIICRTGNLLDIEDLKIANFNYSKSIIILPPDNEEQDIATLKIILAILNSDRNHSPYHIVTEILDKENLDLVEMVGKDQVDCVHSSLIVSKIIAQSCLQPGLSRVYTELLDYSDNEIYFHKEEKLVGQKYGTVLLSFRNSSVIGLINYKNKIMLNPNSDYELSKDDKIIVIAENDHSTTYTKNILTISESEETIKRKQVKKSDKILIINWNKYANQILIELSSYISKNSDITIVMDTEIDIGKYKKSNDFREIGIPIKYLSGDICNRRYLDDLNINNYTHVIILSKLRSNGNIFKSDSRTLVTLLHVRDINKKFGEKFNIVTQLLNDKNRKLAEVSLNDDFIVSERLISLFMSQIAENRLIKPIFNELFSASGAEIYFKPITNYVSPGKKSMFSSLVATASDYNESAIGYKLHNADINNNGIIINPDKNQEIVFNQNDQLIVVSKN